MFPELDLNLVMWVNLAAVIITTLILISAYRREDIAERRFRILASNYDSLLAQQLLSQMEEEDPQKAKEIREKLAQKLKLPEGTPKILQDPQKMDPREAPLEALLMLDRFRKTKEGLKPGT